MPAGPSQAATAPLPTEIVAPATPREPAGRATIRLGTIRLGIVGGGAVARV
jgi:hypothetical protein